MKKISLLLAILSGLYQSYSAAADRFEPKAPLITPGIYALVGTVRPTLTIDRELLLAKAETPARRDELVRAGFGCRAAPAGQIDCMRVSAASPWPTALAEKVRAREAALGNLVLTETVGEATTESMGTDVFVWSIPQRVNYAGRSHDRLRIVTFRGQNKMNFGDAGSGSFTEFVVDSNLAIFTKEVEATERSRLKSRRYLGEVTYR